ncbi:MAG: hypothetical protein WCP55_13725 [Lentisphaerota bacterium]
MLAGGKRYGMVWQYRISNLLIDPLHDAPNQASIKVFNRLQLQSRWKGTRGNSWGDPDKQNTEGDSVGPFPGGRIHEEWLGICSQGSGYYTPRMRQLRPLYEHIRRQWNP